MTEELKPDEMLGAAADPLEREMIAIAPNQLKNVWPSIREKVANIESPEEIIPEEVFAMCASNQATLFILKVGGKEVGFMVVRLILPDLHLWLVHGENGYEIMSTFRTDLMKLAREVKATKITFGSRRRAWQQVSEKHGFKVRMIVYQADVE
jgi:hypothetical protein